MFAPARRVLGSAPFDGLPTLLPPPITRRRQISEEIEIETAELRETIDDEIEKGEKTGARLVRGITLTTAILAALAAIRFRRSLATAAHPRCRLVCAPRRELVLACEIGSRHDPSGL